jgi:beta-glucosidase
VLTQASAALTAEGVVKEGDLTTLIGSADWVGINYYTPFRIGSQTERGRAVGQATAAYPYSPPFVFRPREPRTQMGWEVDATGMEDVLVAAAEQLPGVPLRITENGAAFADGGRGADGQVLDHDRIDFLRRHIDAVERARERGAPVVDYLAWSLLDNFEWAEGYRKTFGLVAVDPDTRDRAPKASFDWYAERIRR